MIRQLGLALEELSTRARRLEWSSASGFTVLEVCEVFKRDSFTCQYCGRSAPDVVLEADHIHPRAEGGSDDVLNLITACHDCNRGKGRTLLTDDQAITRQLDQLKELNERRGREGHRQGDLIPDAEPAPGG